MSIINSMSSRAGRVARDMKGSVRRARLEGERRLLERRHRSALEALGSRAYALIRDGALSGDALAPEVADVENRLAAIDAAVTAMEQDGSDDREAAHDERQSADIAFPMISDEPKDPDRTE